MDNIQKLRCALPVVCLLSTLVFYFSFYPGCSVYDTQNIIYRAYTGVYSGLQPVFLMALSSMLMPFGASVGAIFVIQWSVFFIAISLLSYRLSFKSMSAAYLVIAVCFIPSAMTFLPFILKDTTTFLLLALYCSMYYFILCTRTEILGLTMLGLTGLTILLVRTNALSLAPVLSASIAYLLLPLFLKKRPWKAFVIIFFATFLVLAGGRFAIISTIKSVASPKSTASLLSFQIGYDLVGISIQNGHKGVTQALSKDLRRKLEHEYEGRQIFWGNARKYSPPVKWVNDDFSEWFNAILTNPIAYLKHRIHTFRKLFDGSGQKPYNFNKNGWGLFTKLNFAPGLKHVHGEKAQLLKNNFFYQLFSGINSYHINHSSTIVYPIFNVLILVVLALLFHKNSSAFTHEGRLVLLMNTLALTYYMPFLFFLHHPEIRYVCSLPVK